MSKAKTKAIDKLIDFLKDAPAALVSDLNGTIKHVVSTYGDVENLRTQRATVSARKEIALSEIENSYRIIELFLDKSFNERADVLAGQFAAFDKALDASDSAAAIAALNSIVETMKTSPLKDAGAVRQLMSSNRPIMLE